MTFLKATLAKLCFALLSLIIFSNSTKAQTTLAAGEVAFTGYIAADGANPDRFTFVVLTAIQANTVIRFTDYGWRTDLNAFNSAATLESELVYTAGSAYPAGTEIQISGASATVIGGGSAGTVVYSVGAGFAAGNLNLSSGGDQILAYQGSFASPTFIAGIHMNTQAAANGDPNNTTDAAWDGVIPALQITGSNSSKPVSLTAGTSSLWIGTINAVSPFATEWDNGRFNCGPDVSTAPLARAAINTAANWTISNTTPGFTIPTGCNYMGVLSAPGITGQPANSAICEGTNTSFGITATGATGYQWQVDNGGGFVNVTDNATYSGALTATLNITAAPFSLNGYLYRCIASNGSGSTNSNSATLTITALPVAPSLLAKTPATVIVADGTPVSATFNAGSGGTGCADDFRYSIDGGATYLPYTPGANINTTGLAATGGTVVIEGRRAGCSSGCQGSYVGLASWVVTPLPPAATTLVAGDIAFTSYASSYPTVPEDNFSFVLLRSVGAGTTINFTNNGWLSTNVLQSGEETLTWTAPAGGLIAGTEIRITDLTATKSGGGNAGSVTGTGLNLNTSGDQILAYQGPSGSPIFISAIHMNVFTIGGGDPVNTTAAAWDGTANTPSSSALPTGLTTGVNCIWIGTQGVPASEFNNARYGNCAAAAVSGPVTALRALLNNQANWITDDNTPPSFVLPTGCNYLGTACPTITVTNPGTTTGTVGTAFSQTFTASGGAPAYTFTTVSPLPTGITLSSGGVLSGTPTQSGSFPIVVTATDVNGCAGDGATYTLVISCQTITVSNPANASGTAGTPFSETFTETGSLGGATFTTASTLPLGIALSTAGVLSGTPTQTGTFPIVVTVTDGNGCTGTGTTYNLVIACAAYSITATPASQSRCSGTAIQPILMSSTAGGTTFNWVRDNVPTIGGSIPASGSGNITGNLVNNTGAPVTVTFTITPDLGGCPATPVTATVTVNPLPVALITGPGTVGAVPNCQNSDVVLSGATSTGTGLTYAWGRSLFTTPFTAVGTAQTLPIEVGGNYLLTVTSADGCTDTAMTSVLVADYIFNGNLAPGDAVQTGRLNRFAAISTCAAPKGCPGIFTSTGSRLYDSYTVTNPYSTPVCATIGITSFCSTNIFCAAYLGAYDPNNQCVNYLADGGSSFPTTGFYEATIPGNATITIVIHEVNPGAGCAGYRLSVHLPREGIIATPSAPYCSGTPITLTAPPANNYSWTPGGATTQTIVVNPPLGTTNYSVQSGFGNWGCVGDTSVTLVVGSNPDVNPVSNQFYCAGSSAGPIPFTGSVPGTTYNWTNTNTAIGLAASGTGDIPTFTATNATGAPISGTITVTPVNGPCTGTPITFTITVANTPSITGVTNDEICAPGGVVNLTAAGNGVINWYTAATGGNLVNTGTTFNPNISATTTYYVESQINEPAAQTVAMPGQSSTFPGNVRGYWFTAPVDFVMTGLFVPTTASSGNQQVAVLKFNGNTPPPVFSATTNAFSTLFLTKANTSPGYIAVNIPIKAGEVIGVLGNRADLNSYAPGDYNTTIFGQAVQMQRLGMQFPLSSTDPRDIWREFGPSTSISRIEFTYTSIACSSSPRVPVTGTVNPLPVATATPASQTVCSGPITSIILTSSEPGTTYAWTRDNTVNVTGIAASGTGDISGTLTNNTFVPQTVTFTITPTVTATGCVGAPITATVTVNAVPTITCPANITVNNTLGLCGNTITYTPTFTGIPVPAITYAFTGATTASGSGDGSGSFFNVGATTVTITATNSCGFASCTFTVTVNDTEPPIVTTGSIGSCYPSVAAAQAAALAATSATDNCPGVLTEVASTVGTCSAVITVTTTDVAGNSTAVTYNTRIDNTAPVITCPAPVTVSCASAVPAPDIASVTVTDNCPGAIIITWQGDVISAQTCTNRYTVTRTYRATDVCGNFAECTQIITVNDQTAPTLTCPAPVTVSCAAAVPVPDINSVTGVTDNCGGPVTVTHVSDVISAQTCLNRYTITRTYRATDVCGNFAECTQIITVNDQTPPVITCPANITVNNTPNQCGAIVNFTVTATDNCAGAITITSVPASGSFFPVGTTTVTSTAVDACGNTSTCTFTVTVVDVQPPVITCPANITTGNNPGICGAVVNFPLPTVSDNCPLPGGVTLNQNTNTTTIAFNTGISCNAGATSFWRAYNLASFPAVTGPLTINSVRFGIEVNNTGVGQTMTVNLYNQTGAAFPGGTRTLIATGTVSITAVANTFYTVNFGSAPTVPANAIIIVEVATPVGGVFPAANGLGESGPSYISSTACGVPNPVTLASLGFTANHTIIGMSGTVPVVPPILVQTAGLPSGSTFPVGTTTNTFVARDNAGNTSTCSFTVTVNDVEQPTITCPANQVRNTDPGVCYATFPDPPGIPRPTFADNCAVTRLTWSMTGPGGTTTSPATGINYVPNNTQFLLNGTTGQGITTITYTAADAAGNTRTCSFTVTVNDASIPVISVQPASVFVCEGGNAVFSVTATAGTGNPLGYQWQQWNGSAWVNITGATTSTLTIPAVAFTQNTNTYRVVLTGRCSVVNSAAATLFVNPLPSVTLLTSIPPALQPGQALNITSTVNPPGGTYAWFLNGQLLPTALGSSLTNLTVDNQGTYRLVYTDLNGCVGTSANLVISAFQSEKLWIYPNPNSGRFQIRFYNHVNEKITINVYDMKGARIHQQVETPSANYTRIDVNLGAGIPAGFYNVEVRGGNGALIGNKKIVVHHN